MLRWEIGKVPKEKSPCLNGGVTLAAGEQIVICLLYMSASYVCLNGGVTFAAGE